MNEKSKQTLVNFNEHTVTKPKKEDSSLLAVDTVALQKMLCCGRYTAVQIGNLANARIQIGRRVLWNIKQIQRYLDDIAE